MKRDVAQRRRAEASRNTVEVKRRGLALGFDAVGIATLEANAHAAELDRWLAAGYAGTMTYLHRQAEKRKDPARIMPDAKVAVVTLTNYFHGSDHPGLAPGVSPPPGKVAQYAWSADYHGVLGRRLERLAGEWLFGCDVCQDVCPWSVKFARPTRDDELGVRSDVVEPDLTALLDGNPESFQRRFGDTPFERPGVAGMRRNVTAVLANRRRAHS